MRRPSRSRIRSGGGIIINPPRDAVVPVQEPRVERHWQEVDIVMVVRILRIADHAPYGPHTPPHPPPIVADVVAVTPLHLRPF